MRTALLSLAILVAGGCGLQATESPPARAERPQATDVRAADLPVISANPQVAPSTLPREPVRAAHPRIVRDGEAVVSSSGAATPEDVRSAHLAEVRRLKCGDSRAAYVDQFDHWHVLDLDGDGIDEHLVFFTLEGFGGGNAYSRYLTVYRYVAPVWFPAYTALVGGKGSAGVLGASLRLEGGVLSTEAMLPDEDDATCCPSIRSELSFDVGVGGALTPRPVQISETGAAFHTLLLLLSGCG